ncbi:MAG: CYTH domain-containing protein [Sporolactobacillus sp.]
MAQELEIEYKNMLTSEQFNRLCRFFKLTSGSFFKQINDYFDTPTLALREKQTALRIRHLPSMHDLTLKQPHEGAILETHQKLTDDESQELIQFGVMPAGEVERQITALGIDVDKLIHLGQLRTERCSFPYNGGILFLDHSFYLKKEDFELEWEAANQSVGSDPFDDLLRQHHIERQPSISKIARLYHAIKKAK